MPLERPTPGAHGPVVEALGVRWRLDLDDLDVRLAAELTHLWQRARVDDGTGAALPFVVTTDPTRLPRRRDADLPHGVVLAPGEQHVPYAVSRALTLASLDRRVGSGAVLLHAAGLSTASGAVLALVAPSGTGKTTAAATLGRRLGYLSDETVCIEPDGSVTAYAKPLSVVVDPLRPDRKDERSPDDLGLLPAPAATRLAAVAVLDRRPQLRGVVVDSAGLLDTLVDVVPQSSSLARLDRPLARLAEVCTAGVGPYRVTYSDIAAAADALVALVENPRLVADLEPVAWTSTPGTRGADATGVTLAGALAGTSRDRVELARTTWQDAVHAEGGSLVLRDGRPHRLDGLASVVWQSVDRPRSLTDLTAAVVAAHGDHEDAASLVARACEVLVGSGLLAVRALP